MRLDRRPDAPPTQSVDALNALRESRSPNRLPGLRRGRGRGPAHTDAGVDGDVTLLQAENRVQVQLGDLRELLPQAGEPGEEAHQRGGVGSWAAAKSGDEAPGLPCVDERVHVGLSIGPIDAASVRDAIYVATHVDVIPPRKDDGVAALKRLGDESRRGDGNLRFEVVQQANRPNHFTVVEMWKDAKAVEAHSMAAVTREFRDKLATMTGALYDERMYKAVD